MTQNPQHITPMFEQYLSIKEKHQDALLFYRMGDFYELFFDDAVVAAKILQIALTSRNPKAEDPIPMCGVPWHAASSYAHQLVNHGHKVAICEQIGDPKAKGIVKREVVRVLTAGTTLDDACLDATEHNYLAALYWDEGKSRGGIAWADVSTGTWSGIQVKKIQDLWQWTLKMAPKELLIADTCTVPSLLKQGTMHIVSLSERTHFDLKRATERMLRAQKVAELATVGLDGKPELLRACGALLAYMEHTQMQDVTHLVPFSPLDMSKHLIIDEVTQKNLELFRTLDGRKGKGTLRSVFEGVLTPMGSRLLEERLQTPLRDIAIISATHDTVEWFVAHEDVLKNVRTGLAAVYDLERLSTRINLNRTTPRDFLALRQSLAALPSVAQAFTKAQKHFYATAEEIDFEHLPPAMGTLMRQWDNVSDLYQLLENALADSPPPQITDGGLFKAGYNDELDALLELVEHGEEKLKELLEEEQEATGIQKLKLGYNRVFGYYFEVSNALAAKLPDNFIRRQSLANAERFVTARLKELEEKLLAASDQRKSLEFKLFVNLRELVAEARPRLLFMAHAIGHLDFWQALAETAIRHKWCRPTLVDEPMLAIVEGRHPVVEQAIGAASFVANDLYMNEKKRLLLITGPNMAGKSTILRQSAIISLLAQMGSFVPAKSATLGVCDRIFSRVGASDNLAQGQSTFMVEMMETARILRQATHKSLVILDEIGRGTSTFDGLALAWAVVEELIRRAKGTIRTLFATHYHELTVLEGELAGVHTMNVAIQEWNNDIVFLRRLVPGPADRSYGVEVARLAGVPQPVVQRARELLQGFEKGKVQRVTPSLLPGFTPKSKPKTEPEPKPEPPQPLASHPLLVELQSLDPNTLTPLDALHCLTKWKQLWGHHEK